MIIFVFNFSANYYMKLINATVIAGAPVVIILMLVVIVEAIHKPNITSN